MTSLGQKVTIAIVATIILAICAFFLHDSFLQVVYGQFRDLDVSLVGTSTSLLGNPKSLYTFVAVIASLPALFLFAHFLLKDQKPSIFLFIVPITLLFGIALMEFHIYSLRYEIQKMNEMSFFGIQNSISIDNILAERYLGIGFLIGAISSTATLSFIYRENRA